VSRGREENVDQATEQMTEVVRESYQTIAEGAVALQERNVRFSQSFFETCNETLRRQAESNRDMAQALAKQIQRQQAASRIIVQESVGAYMDFLNSMFSFSQQGHESAKRAAEE
jgi:cbb3-type cytochrome oxidase cytochrome c subunit